MEDTYSLYLQFLGCIGKLSRVESITKRLVVEARSHTEDAIGYVALKFLQEPITISLIDRNLCLFKSDPTLSVSLNTLHNDELKLLRKMIGVALHEDRVLVREQRGGAHCLVVVVPYASQEKITRAVLLAAIFRLLRGFPHEQQVANVVMQRLRSACVIKEQDFVQAREILIENPSISAS